MNFYICLPAKVISKICVCKRHIIYSIPHLPYNGGVRFAGVNLRIISQYDAIKNKKDKKKFMFGQFSDEKPVIL